MNNSRSSIRFRRQKVLELLSEHYTQREVSTILMCAESTITNDVRWIKKQCSQTIADYVDNLAYEYLLTITGLNNTINELWKDVKDPENNIREKQNAKGMLIHAYKQRIEMLSATEPLHKMIRQVVKKRDNTSLPIVEDIRVLKDNDAI